MSSQEYKRIISMMEKKNITIREIVASFHVETLEEFANVMVDFINDNKEFLVTTEFFSCYHLFLYTLIELVKDEEDYYVIINMIDRSLKVLKDIAKPYNKNEKSKDDVYYLANKYMTELKANRKYAEGYVSYFQEGEEFQIVWFILTQLKNADYLFRLIELHPEYVNLKNKDNKCLFGEFIRYIISNLKEIELDDIKSYKRLVVLLLESDCLRVSTDDLVELLEYLENSLISASVEDKNIINFIINEIGRHYSVINVDARVNCVDYCNTKSPIEIIKRDKDERVDLTNIFTFSIDSIKDNNPENILIDDAISIVEKKNGELDVYVHIPDVDFFVKKDSETDNYMRSIGESVYAKGYKTPMLDYKIAKKCSLLHGNVRPALTFIISLDSLGNVKDINFRKTNINVNYNLSKSYAEYFYKSAYDKNLFEVLRLAKMISAILRKKRGEKVGNLSMSSLIVEEFNVLTDIVVADYFKNQGLVFPYKNYLGKKIVRTAKDVTDCEMFNRTNNISEEGRNILYSVFDIYNRIYYDTQSVGNKAFGGRDVGNVGNPLREYISLETNRLIKDLVISGEKNFAYWEERIERDCIEYTETSAKIKSLYKAN